MEQKTEASQAVKFRKKPVEIEAIQWTGKLECLDAFNIPELHQSLGSKNVGIPTLEGTMIAHVGDWIIKGVKGEFYPCKPDIFELTYERAALKAQPAPTEAAQDESPIKFRPWSKEAEMVEGWTAAEKACEAAQVAQLSGNSGELQPSGNSGELAQGEDSARLDFIAAHGCDGGDYGNTDWYVAGETYLNMPLREAIDRARASAETGGVKF